MKALEKDRTRRYETVDSFAADVKRYLDNLPVGWTDRQDAGQYRLEQRADAALFGYAVGPHSWKRFLHPPVERLWQARREGDGFAIIEDEAAAEPLAFIGVRACESRMIRRKFFGF